MCVAHHVADRAAHGNFLIERLFFQFLQVVVFALDVERRKVVLLFVGDLFLFHQPGYRRSVFQIVLNHPRCRRSPSPVPSSPGQARRMRQARGHWPPGADLQAPAGILCFRDLHPRPSPPRPTLDRGGGKTKFTRRGRINTIRGRGFLRLKLTGRQQRLIRQWRPGLLCWVSAHCFGFRLRRFG